MPSDRWRNHYDLYDTIPTLETTPSNAFEDTRLMTVPVYY